MAVSKGRGRKTARKNPSVKSTLGAPEGPKAEGGTRDALRMGAPVPWDKNDPSVIIHHDPAGRRATLVHHLNYPYIRQWDETPAQLFAHANDYLAKVASLIDLPARWRNDLPPDFMVSDGVRPYLRWLRNAPGESDIQLPWQPASSFWSSRRYHAEDFAAVKELAPFEGKITVGQPLDRIAVLVAGLVPFRKDEYAADQWIFNGGRGLRVVAQVTPATRTASASLRFTSCYSTLPAWSGTITKRISTASSDFLPEGSLVPFVTQAIARAFGLEADDISDLGLRAPDDLNAHLDEWMILAKARANPVTDPDGVSWSLSGHFNWTERRYVPTAKVPLMAFADVQTAVFAQDPISKAGLGQRTTIRPNRASVALNPWRIAETFHDLPVGGIASTAKLVDPPSGAIGGSQASNFQVTNSRFVEPGTSESAPKEVMTQLHVDTRTNDQAAANAYFQSRQMFAKMRSFGLQPDDYFKFAERPINVRYRSTIVPGARDGRTVNAQVRWNVRPGPNQANPAKGQVDMCFAMGDLDSSIHATPLGIAADPRWSWHEFSHVLLGAAIGEMEFRFAHSAGDALAAIACDPDSLLADHPTWRGITFPWIEIPGRRHDRAPGKGWNWRGSLYRREHTEFGPECCDRRTYWSEQILSSTLFHFYRAIGGDTQQIVLGQHVKDPVARKAASDYVLYLIMRSIQVLGPANQVPAETPQALMVALRLADIESTANPLPLRYPPGLVHKVINWAFAEQGLDVSSTSGGAHVPRASLYLADRRHGASGSIPIDVSAYAPINFVDETWHARTSTIRVLRRQNAVGDAAPRAGTRNWVAVQVYNLGDQVANGVVVEVWWAEVLNDLIPPFPNQASAVSPWHSLGSRSGTIGKGSASSGPGQKRFGPLPWVVPPTAGKRYALLATATCVDDRSNVDPSTALPTATSPSPVGFLVAFDDNLGLRVVNSV